jgi:uncharacterized integral membrane protein
MRYVKIVVGVLVVILAVVFVLQNQDLLRPIRLGFDPLSLFKGQPKVEAPAPGATPGTAPAPDQAKPAEGGMPAFVLIFIAFFLGVLLASAYGLGEKYRLKKLVREGLARNREIEEELRRLRNLPLSQPQTPPTVVPLPPAKAEVKPPAWPEAEPAAVPSLEVEPLAKKNKED